MIKVSISSLKNPDFTFPNFLQNKGETPRSKSVESLIAEKAVQVGAF